MDEILADLVTESREKLQEIEPDFLALENDVGAADDELVNRIFRAVHSIKGGFSFFGGATNIVNLSHAMENVMSRVRDKEISVIPEMVNVMLAGIDKLNIMLDDCSRANEISVEQEIKDLAPFLDESIELEADADKESIPTDGTVNESSNQIPTNVDLKKLAQNGQKLYKIDVKSHQDVFDKKLTFRKLFNKWNKFGDVLLYLPEDAELKNTEWCPLDIEIYFASVLENALVLPELGCSPEQVHEIAYLDKLKQKEAQEKSTFAQGIDVDSAPDLQDSKIKLSTVDESLRVKVKLLANLMNNAGELVLGRNQLMQNLGRSFATTADAERIKTIISSKMEFVLAKSLEELKNGKDLSSIFEESSDQLKRSIHNVLDFSLLEVEGLNAIVQNMDMVTSIVQGNIMQTRLQPISVIFGKFPRLVRDISRQVNKQVELVLIGKDVELDKSILEQLSDPLVHLIRNCLDHGIELPELRAKFGKREQGKVILKAAHEGGKINISIEDDGGGISIAKIKKRVLEKEFATEEEFDALSRNDQFLYIFYPGFSTAAEVTDISGRGVGMDVVKTNITKLGGTIEIESEEGKGTKILLKLPLTLAIIPSLLIKTGDRSFAVPQVSLDEIVRIRTADISSRIQRVHGADVLRLREELLPLVWLTDVLGIERTFINAENAREADRRLLVSDRRMGDLAVENTVDELTVVDPAAIQTRSGQDRRLSINNALKILVLKSEENKYGLVVEDVLDSEEIVVKPLSTYINDCPFYSGATIMGDGKVIMILDSTGIVEQMDLKFNDLRKRSEELETIKEDLCDLMLFSNSDNEHMAMYLSDIARVEKHHFDEIEMIGEQQYIKYEDTTLKLVNLHDYMAVTAPETRENDHFFVIVPKDLEKPFGIVVAAVEDVVKVPLNLDKKNITGVGIAGSMILDKVLRLFIDIEALSEAVDEVQVA